MKSAPARASFGLSDRTWHQNVTPSTVSVVTMRAFTWPCLCLAAFVALALGACNNNGVLDVGEECDTPVGCTDCVIQRGFYPRTPLPMYVKHYRSVFSCFRLCR